MFTSPGTTLTAGSTIDLEILHDLFTEFAQASQELGVDPDIRLQVEAAKKRSRRSRSARMERFRNGWTTGDSARKAIDTSPTCGASTPATRSRFATHRRWRTPAAECSSSAG